ncbi:MAG: PDZ domain-containing protein [Magnetococcales bacterium]|nr:PDZ domain-containing protein [Magnetococcales bacterium]
MRFNGNSIVTLGLLLLVVVFGFGLFSSPDYSQLPVSTGASTRTAPGLAGVSGVSGVEAIPVALQPMPLGMGRVESKGGAFTDPAIQLSEGHWQGMEALPLSAELKKKLKLPSRLKGLLIDEVTLYAATSGMRAGDVLIAVNSRPVLTLEDLVRETKRLQARQTASLTVYRNGDWKTFTLAVPEGDNLGFAQVETAPLILPGAMRPHPYRGPCTQCHAIGVLGKPRMPDPDGILLPPPPISANATMPHQDRGPCQVCHKIVN